MGAHRAALHTAPPLDLTSARFAGPMVIIELDMKFGGLELRLPEGASASIDDVEVVTVPGVGHAPDLSEPAAVAAIDRLLERVLKR